MPLTVLVVDNSRAVTGALNAMRHATGPLRPGIAFEYMLPTGSMGQAVLEADGYRVHDCLSWRLAAVRSICYFTCPCCC
jgi:hypothetical protein